MYLESVLVSRHKTQADEQISRIMSELKTKKLNDVYRNKHYQSSIRANQKFIDSQLTQQSININTKLKTEVDKFKVEYVLVSPLRADLQTCYDLFGESETVTVSVEPSLTPRINSFANISQDNTAILQKFKVKPVTFQLDENSKWFVDYGKEEHRSGERSFANCLKEIERDEDYQTQAHYHIRLEAFKKNLINHIGKTKTKLAIIAHPVVLEALTSTGHHEDYQLINNVPFSFGEVKSQHIWIEGVVGELENSSIPFCS